MKGFLLKYIELTLTAIGFLIAIALVVLLPEDQS